MLGPDRKILRTRSGAPLRLMALLDEAVPSARRVIDEARPDLHEETRAAIAPQVGIGAVKYADLSVAHDSEYVFDLDRMVALTGNTGPYLQYAAARIRSIFRTAGIARPRPGSDIGIGAARRARPGPARCSSSASVVEAGRRHLEPHRLCTYLFQLAQAFSAFYEHCPVLKAEPDSAVHAWRCAL